MKILMLLENNPYPQDSRVRKEAQSLVQAGHQVSIICPAAKHQPRYETIAGVTVYRYPAPPEAQGLLGYVVEYGYSLVMSFIFSLIVLARSGFDVIHAHNPPDIFVFVALFYKVLGKKFVFDHHDISPELYSVRFADGGNLRVRQILMVLEKLSCRAADAVIATNDSYKRIEMERAGISEKRIGVVRNGPSLTEKNTNSPTPQLDTTGKTVIGYVGIIGYQDGVDYLIRALYHLICDLNCTEVLCLIVGKGDALEAIKHLTREKNLENYVHFAGWVDSGHLAGYFNLMDICAAPEPTNHYNDHCTMIKVMEYMSFSKPIVAFDLPEHRFSAQAAALYTPDNNAFEYARNIQKLIQNPALRQEMGAYGRTRIENTLAWEYQAQELIRIYGNLG